MLLTAGLVFSHLSCTALAAQTEVPADQTEVGAAQTAAEKLTPVTIPEEARINEAGSILSGIRIGGIDAPVPGMPFDTEAVVTTAGGVTWLLPVMWVDANKVPVGPVAGNSVYYPVIVFCLPYGTAMDPADGSRVLLDEQTTALFGKRGILSVYDREHQFTLILPGDLYLPAQPIGSGTDGTADSAAPVYTPSPAPAAPAAPTQDQDDQDQGSQGPTDEQNRLIELYCSETAKDAFAGSLSELGELVDLVVNSIQPQAVNLLLDKFPAFKQGAENGEIGKEISLYVYYAKGDQDGKAEHENAPGSALAYVDGGMITYTDDNTSQYCYMIGLNAKSFSVTDKDGKRVLNRGKSDNYDTAGSSNLDDLDNTMTHELLHAIMDDYNRTGMEGVASVAESQKNRDTDPEAKQLYQQTHFPAWFIEGTASQVENILQYRDDSFIELRKDYSQLTEEGKATIQDAFTGDILFDIYVNSGFDNNKYDKIYYDLEYADNTEVNHDDLLGSQYISGYLACLYLGKMAASQKLDQNAVTVDPATGKTTFSSEAIRGGMNQIYQDLHDGKTLDQEIQEISGGAYTSADNFAKRFIKGEYDDQNQIYVRDQASLTFCVDYLNYMESMAQGDQLANGSILFDFDKQYKTPLDRSQTASTETLKIVEDNGSHASTVDNDTALAGGGKSRSGPEAAQAQQTEESAPAEEESQTLTFPESQPAETSGQAARMPAAEVSETEEVQN